MASWEQIVKDVVIAGRPDLIREAATEWERHLTNMANLTKNLEDGLGDIAKTWTGAAADAYHENVHAVATSVAKMEKDLRPITTALNTAAEKLDTAIQAIPIPAELIQEVNDAKGLEGRTPDHPWLPDWGDQQFWNVMKGAYLNKYFSGALDVAADVLGPVRDVFSDADEDAQEAYEQLTGEYSLVNDDMPKNVVLPRTNTQNPLPDYGAGPGGGGSPDIPSTGVGGAPDLPSAGTAGGTPDLPGAPTTDGLPTTPVSTGLNNGYPGVGTGGPSLGGTGSGPDLASSLGGPGGAPVLGTAGGTGLGGPGLTGSGVGGGPSGTGVSGLPMAAGAGRGAGRAGSGAGRAGSKLPLRAAGPATPMGTAAGAGRGAGRGTGKSGPGRTGLGTRGGGIAPHGHSGGDEYADRNTWLEEDDDVWGAGTAAIPSVIDDDV